MTLPIIALVFAAFVAGCVVGQLVMLIALRD
jgi:hypothetical protein